MSFHISGLLAIPSEPQVTPHKLDSGSGFFINFRGTTQGKTVDGKPDYQYWFCTVFVSSQFIEKWMEEYLIPGNVLYIESGEVVSTPTPDGKYHNTKIKLDQYKTKLLAVPMWAKQE